MTDHEHLRDRIDDLEKLLAWERDVVVPSLVRERDEARAEAEKWQRLWAIENENLERVSMDWPGWKWKRIARRMARVARGWRGQAEADHETTIEMMRRIEQLSSSLDEARAIARMLIDGKCPACGGFTEQRIGFTDHLARRCFHCDYTSTRADLLAELK
jgi:hypothetical protein